MAAAVANVLAESPPFLEQAVFADELSRRIDRRAARARRYAMKALLAGLVRRSRPWSTPMPSADVAKHHVRVGMYGCRRDRRANRRGRG